ncbi:phosphate/phosphite/phosphonate ABC transporter substrate-binding protein [Methylocapsa acidiphila]|uniref:phosphate/phosphite/phosphonate ABC transporter substrate-binding protein n=1 Tax=Methylocapsa acidiphila TaxID=133552 RepID=UPI000420B9F9|nr:PhnD/SsuA/transferrin family substrate-binding protein [Methylocapsa acidiphila]
MRIAALPMYEFVAIEPETDRFWRAVRTRLQDAGIDGVPNELTRSPDYQMIWRHPRLLLGQACGYPFAKHLRNRARAIATPIYAAEGCLGPQHRSFFIVNARASFATLADLRGRACAINGFDSNTGMNLLRAAIAPIARKQAFFSSIEVTGSHLASVEAVAEGLVDLASIDCVTFAHLKQLRTDLTVRVKTIGQSALAPAPPFITARETNAEVLRLLYEILEEVASDPELEPIRKSLLIAGFASAKDEDYQSLLRIEREAAEIGYPELC